GPPWADVALVQRWLLRLLLAAAIIHTLSLKSLTAGEVALAALTFAFAALGELWTACSGQREERVWTAEALALAAAGYLAYFRVVAFGHGTSMFVVLGVGVLLWLAGEWAARRRTTAVLTRPLQLTGMLMPLATVGIGVGRHFHAARPNWLGT